ncbi:hypothetical protein [Agriterribacter sp.]|uniref:hypothetical protein n=1 Tax=Agriterribacter sp. TaxID=2821509 RepID=UPI002C29A266|nr:hypothetical protein [Agriterribacter sp.]HTN08398.1 hypothetical protein [Agriterribacter sp.]
MVSPPTGDNLNAPQPDSGILCIFKHMTLSAQIAKHFRQIHFGGNWTSVNLKETLTDTDWQQATMKVLSFNTIAALVYHMNYYVIQYNEQ